MTWKESCCGSSVTCKGVVVKEADVWCVLCVSLSVCCSVAVCCSVCCCCCCGSVVVVGARGGAGVVVGSSLLPREVVGVVATAGESVATQTVVGLEVDDDVPPAAAVVASAAGSGLVAAVEEGNVEDPDSKAKAARC